MVVNFYKCSSPDNYTAKTNSDGVTLAFRFLDESNILNPTIEVQSTTDLLTYNYCTMLSRSYFITDIVLIGYNRYRVVLREDVLSTYWDSIKSLNAVILRNENDYNMYVADSKFIVQAKSRVTTKLFDTGFSNAMNCILVVGGA